jgi:hypothetical protein
MARKPVLVVLFALVILLAVGLSGVHAVAVATAPGTRPLWLAVPSFVPIPPPPPVRARPTGLVSIAATGDLAPDVDLPGDIREALRADLATGNPQGPGRRTPDLTVVNGAGVTTVEIRGIRISVLGFSFAPGSHSITDLTAARRVVTAAATDADLVVVHAHMGAPGRYRTTVGAERYRGVDRGDPVRFAHAVVDAGADLVLGHGSGVLRGMEFHRGRLIAYSLGTFTAAEPRTGRYANAGVLRVTLHATGGWAGGTFTPTRPDRGGRPVPDRTGLGLRQVRELSAADFPATGPVIGETGRLSGG